MMNKKTKLHIAGALVGILGSCVIGFSSSWWIALGVLIMITGNNIEYAARQLSNWDT